MQVLAVEDWDKVRAEAVVAVASPMVLAWGPEANVFVRVAELKRLIKGEFPVMSTNVLNAVSR